MIKVYGIKNCDTVRKARRWLADHDIEHQFVDIRETPLDLAQYQAWLAVLGDTMLNKRSPTWRSLSDQEKASVEAGSAASVLVEYPTLMKRPLLDNQGELLVGFKADLYQALID